MGDDIDVRRLGPVDIEAILSSDAFDHPARPDQPRAFLDAPDTAIIGALNGDRMIGFASATELGYEMARENLMAKVREMVAATARPSAAPASPQVAAGE